MKVEQLQSVDQATARDLYRKYQEHRAYQQPHDAEIASIYKRIARGQTVIRALESIRAAGMDERGLPRLAIARADTKFCYWNARMGGAQFSDQRWWCHRDHIALNAKVVPIDWPGMPQPTRGGVYEAVVPLIRVHLRPKRGLQNYHVLWEAEWTQRYPVDPYLLRRFGGDAWLVVAAWDLTDVERAVMSARVRGN